MKHILYYTAVVTLLVAFALMLYVGYLLFYPFNTLELYNQPSKVVTPLVRAGDPMRFQIDYCKRTDAPARVTRQLIGRKENPQGYTVIQIDPQPVVSNVPQGCINITTSVLVPPFTTPGRYYLQATSVYQINPLRSIQVIWSTEEFEILE